ncbi:aminopeptidase [Acutalibacter caecimuris]|uniref:aminopeptidase n=1 Tax=Acutalibacter caecimuris TaxID=3093657 RepID=UPI002AC95F13|nr:aminopeptidase [Acutalibacter sp. M00118]
MEENKSTMAKELAEKLLLDRAKSAREACAANIGKAMDFAEGYKDFIDGAKTEREAVDWAVQAAKAAGFQAFDPNVKYSAGDKVYYNNRGKAMCLAVIGKKGAAQGVRIAAAHIDSPRIDLKPIPLYESNELCLLKTHYYGGIKKYQWAAIPLALHGKIVRRDGSEVVVNIGENQGDPQFCITDILPHLGKDQSVKKLGEAFTGEDLNVLVGSLPLDKEGEQLYKLNVMKILNEQYGIVEGDLISAELEFVPAFKAADVGFDRSMVGAYGHDDRVCAYPALQALFDCEAPEKTSLVVLADKEEIGSVGNTGLASEYMNYFVADLAEAEGQNPRRVWSQSSCLSADVTAALDPTYISAYEPGNSTYLNRGVGIAKYTGSRGKGGSNDASAEFLGWVRRVLDDAGVLWQIGELGKVDQGGGGTVAYDVARLNADVIDIGVPVLSMHSPFEVISKIDLFSAYQAFKAYFEAE